MTVRDFVVQLVRLWLWLIGVIVIALALGGCTLFSTTGEEYAGVNYGKYCKTDGTCWEIAGGKDGTNVQFHAKHNVDGSAEVTLSADNYDATSVLAQANKALAERLAVMTDLLLKLAGPAP